MEQQGRVARHRAQDSLCGADGNFTFRIAADPGSWVDAIAPKADQLLRSEQHLLGDRRDPLRNQTLRRVDQLQGVLTQTLLGVEAFLQRMLGVMARVSLVSKQI